MAKNPIDIGAKIYEVLTKLYGKAFTNNMMGTQSNVVKPVALDANAPTKNEYSKSAFKNSKTLEIIDEKIMEYAPTVLANKNMKEKMNFLENAENLLASRKKQTGSDMPGLKSETKKEAEILDIKTKKKMDDEGIMALEKDLGLPPEVSPKSDMGKNLQELKRLTKETELQKKDIDETMDTGLENIFRTFMQQPSKNTVMEGKRRAVIRKILLKDDRINLPEDVEKSLKNYDDLRGGGTKEMDPLTIFDTYYKRDTKKLETLDSIIDTAINEVKAADEFQFLEDWFELKTKKKPIVRESLDDEAVELEETSELPDPDEFAEGGRIGFAGGGVKALIAMMNKKFGKDAVKTADKVKLTDEMMFEKENRRLLEELRDYKDIAPDFYTRMSLKLKYPGISDELIAKIMADDNPQRIAEVMATMDEGLKMMEKGMKTDDIISTFKNTPRTKNAGGGLNYLMGL